MATLSADFRADLLALSRSELRRDWGEQADQIVDDFQCPPEYAAGWANLRRKVEA